MKAYCPYCRKEEEYKIEKRKVNKFKGILVNTFENVGVCEKCKNDLYINDLENENLKRLYKVYRKNANIITPKEIINLRKKYDLSQRELTAILEFGKMTINKYERGATPTKTQSDYLKLLINNEKEFLNKVTEAFNKKNISEKTYNKVINKEETLSDEHIKELYRMYIIQKLTRDLDIYNGYAEFNLDLVENIISYIASKVNNLTITSLNKYLWYIDLISFSRRAVSITGITYQKQKYGPTIIEGLYNDIAALELKYSRKYQDDVSGTKIYIKSNNNYNLELLKKEEKKIIDEVINLLKGKKVNEISDMSHKEKGYKKTKMYEKISFEYIL